MAAEVEAYRASHESRHRAKGDLSELLNPVPLSASEDGAQEYSDYHAPEQSGKPASEQGANVLPLNRHSLLSGFGNPLNRTRFRIRNMRNAPGCVGGVL